MTPTLFLLCKHDRTVFFKNKEAKLKKQNYTKHYSFTKIHFCIIYSLLLCDSCRSFTVLLENVSSTP